LEVSPTYQRLLGIATALFLVTGCGDKKLDKPLPATNQKLVVEGPWKNGARIPVKYTCDGTEVKPEVGSSEPRGAKDVAFVMTDPDAPGGTFVHWTHWGSDTEGKNSFGKTGYNGPCPPKGDKAHHYRFRVMAMDVAQLPDAPADVKALADATEGHVLGTAELTATYRR